MPQLMLPIFPKGSTAITADLTFEKRDDQVTYFHGLAPVFTHPINDTASFRMITSQFFINGHARQMDIVRAFGVTPISVKRSVSTYRDKGPAGFYAPRRTRGAAVLTPSVLESAQEKLDTGLAPREVADALGIKRDTLVKAIRAGRLHQPGKKGGPRKVAPRAPEA